MPFACTAWWNSRMSKLGPRAFWPRAELVAPSLAELLSLDDAGFRQVFAGSPIKRIGRGRMIRNALIAAGNGGDASLLPAVTALLGHEDETVRGAAARAAARLGRVEGCPTLTP